MEKEKNGKLLRALENIVFSSKLYDSRVEIRLPDAGEEIVVRNWSNTSRGGSGKVVAVFPKDNMFIVDIRGVTAKYIKDNTGQHYWKCIETDGCERSVTAFIAVCREDGRFTMLYSP
ncbi:MAG: hypothetical protein WC022_03385 [Parcubacteria group bacterium]